jgi:hypothetical protein
MKPYSIFFMVLLWFSSAKAEVFPRPGDTLNQTQLMFEWNKVSGADRYLIEIIENRPDATFEHPLISRFDSATATLIEHLNFGKKYLWRYCGIVRGQKTAWEGAYPFEIVNESFFDKNLIELNVLKNDSVLNNGGLIVLDCIHAAVDRNGNVVWYLPKINWHWSVNKKIYEIKPQVLDLRFTLQGTVTFIADSSAMECDIHGNVLWKAPNNGSVSGGESESYNHDFKRLPNGNYMVLGNKFWRKLPSYSDTAIVDAKYPVRVVRNGVEYGKAEFGTLIEYDRKGNLVWNWSSENYLDKNPLLPLKDSGMFELKAHVNAFSTDRKNEFVYVGFRDISRVIKIEKKTGRVVYSWGEKLLSGEARDGAGFFYKQHDANILANGSLAVFNNNDRLHEDSLARIVVFSQPVAKGDSKILWQFDCKLDSLPTGKLSRNGGNVDELNNGNFLVCTGNMNRILEITVDKKIVWDLSVKNKVPNVSFTLFHRVYRAHYISSLYPCYFTCQANKDTLNGSDKQLSLSIYNKGSEADSYAVAVVSSSGAYSNAFTTANVPAGSSDIFKITLPKKLSVNDQLKVLISSNTNPDFKREINLHFSNK